MPSLKIRLLGSFVVSRDGELIGPGEWPTQKTQSLLKVLLTERGHIVPKERLMELLWPDLAPRSAANSLRVGISHLRRILEPALDRPADSTFILTHSQGYTFHLTPRCWIDVDAFQNVIARGQQSEQRAEWGPAIAAYQSAQELYRGDYLEEDPYEDWAIGPREQLREAYLDGLSRLAECHAHQGHHRRALAACQKVLALDPLRESVYRQVMVYHHRLGQRDQALRAFEQCRGLLADELGVDPMPETVGVHTRILREEPVNDPVLIRPTPVPARPGRRPLPAWLPFVGREEETEALAGHLAAAMEGYGRLVLIAGEAGVGKTRLAEEFLALAEEHGAQVFQGRAYEPERDLPYQPVRESLRRYLLRLDPDRLQQVLGAWAPHVAVLVPEIKQALPDLPALEPVAPEEERRRLVTGLTQFCLSLAARRPVVFCLDDLQWADPSTLQFLHVLVRHSAHEPVLLLGTYRSEEVQPDHPLTTVERHLMLERLADRLDLRRLSAEAVGQLVAQKAAAGWNSAPFSQRLYRETEGNPLFLAEMLRKLLEAGLLTEDTAGCWQPAPGADTSARLSTSVVGDVFSLPATVRAVIEARCRAAGRRGQRVLRTAAVIGQTFTFDLVARTSDLDMEALLDALDDLVARQLVNEQLEGDHASYNFSHDKIREVVYQGLHSARRMHLHRRAATALEALYAGRTEEVAAPLARHYQAAGLVEPAVGYLLQAGQQAIQLSAHEEAITHLTRGLELLGLLPDTPERAQRELDLQMALGVALVATRGYTAPEVEQTYVRARELCQQVGATRRLFRVLWGLAMVYALRSGTMQRAREFAEELVEVAEQLQDPAYLLLAYDALGSILRYLGDHISGLAYLEQAIALYDPEKHHSLTFRFAGEDPGVASLDNAAVALWFLGYPDQALDVARQALALAQDLSHPYTLAHALCNIAMIHSQRREARATQEQAEAVISISSKQGFPYWLTLGMILRGWALVEQGQVDEGVPQIEEGWGALQSKGALAPLASAHLAEGYGKAGQVEEGLAVIAHVLAGVSKVEGDYGETELYRLKGELLLRQAAQAGFNSPLVDEAEACFHRAIKIARRQQAKSWELRAAISLGRLWQQRGRTEEARQLLAEIYGWFTEGFDTGDLKEAKALLDVLSGH